MNTGLHLSNTHGGLWYFVGNGPGCLFLDRADGQEPTIEDYANARHVGPKIAGMVTRTYRTSDEAIRHLRAAGAVCSIQ